MAEVNNGPLVPESDWWAYALAGLLALGGSIARAGRWVDPVTGNFSFSQLGIEMITSFVIGAIAVGAGVYWGLPLPVAGALAGLGGLIGPAAIIGSLQAFIKKRIGG